MNHLVSQSKPCTPSSSRMNTRSQANSQKGDSPQCKKKKSQFSNPQKIAERNSEPKFCQITAQSDTSDQMRLEDNNAPQLQPETYTRTTQTQDLCPRQVIHTANFSRTYPQPDNFPNDAIDAEIYVLAKKNYEAKQSIERGTLNVINKANMINGFNEKKDEIKIKVMENYLKSLETTEYIEEISKEELIAVAWKIEQNVLKVHYDYILGLNAGGNGIDCLKEAESEGDVVENRSLISRTFLKLRVKVTSHSKFDILSQSQSHESEFFSKF